MKTAVCKHVTLQHVFTGAYIHVREIFIVVYMFQEVGGRRRALQHMHWPLGPPYVAKNMDAHVV